MKTHSILFNTEMVQAILQGRKTQTRIRKGLNIINIDPSDWKMEKLKSFWAKSDVNGFKELKKPYEIGDVLWVRESFYTTESENHLSVSQLYFYKSKIFYTADIQNYETIRPLHRGKNRSSTHMRKSFARIFLKIKDVRIERLNDISDKDSIAEGIKIENHEGEDYYFSYPNKGVREDSYSDTYSDSPKTSFCSLWNSINGEKAWALNPWVWVVEFERVEKPINF